MHVRLTNIYWNRATLPNSIAHAGKTNVLKNNLFLWSVHVIDLYSSRINKCTYIHTYVNFYGMYVLFEYYMRILCLCLVIRQSTFNNYC